MKSKFFAFIGTLISFSFFIAVLDSPYASATTLQMNKQGQSNDSIRASSFTTDQGNLEVQVEDPSFFVSSWWQSCAIASDKTLKCWGSNYDGQLGNEDGYYNNPYHKTLRPTSVVRLNFPNFFPLDNVDSVALGFHHSCALSTTGQVGCWGSNEFGQLGTGSFYFFYRRVFENWRVERLPTAKAVFAGHSTNCAITLTDTVWCWGRDYEIFRRSRGHVDYAVEVTGLSEVASVAIGSMYACALLLDQTVECWGQNGSGQLGRGFRASDRYAPAPVSDLSGVTSIASTSRSTCAVLLDKTVKCWGSTGGMIGDGSVIDRWAPVSVVGLVDVVSISSELRRVLCCTSR
jgi:alpha-tubulin suppressor-like RCC1 family protein